MIMGVLYFLGIAFLLLLPFIAAAAVQIVLSHKRRKWWLGLLLPAFCVLAGGVLGIGLNGLPVAGSRPLAALWLCLSTAVILLLVWGILPGKARPAAGGVCNSGRRAAAAGAPAETMAARWNTARCCTAPEFLSPHSPGRAGARNRGLRYPHRDRVPPLNG